MAFTIEDGTGRADAESYASVATFKAYAKARGATVPGVDTDCEILLRRAFDTMREGSPYMAGRRYLGERATRDQAGDFPRDCVEIDCFTYSRLTLPRYVEQAQCALAVALQKVDTMPTVPASATGAVIEKSVGPQGVTVRYENSGHVRNVPADASADALLSKLCRRNGLMAIRT